MLLPTKGTLTGQQGQQGKHRARLYAGRNSGQKPGPTWGG